MPIYIYIYIIHMCVHVCLHTIGICTLNMFGNDSVRHDSTCFSQSCTELLSPPESALPHVTTDPSSTMAAKALLEA